MSRTLPREDDFLAAMAAGSRVRARAAESRTPATELQARVAEATRPPPLELRGDFDLIAEVKLRSPAAGALARGTADDVAERSAAYAQAGAAAVSVLTEPSRFDGALEHLAAAARRIAPLGVPVMRKDFLVDAYQLLEARAAGAGGVLLILRMLPRREVEQLLAQAAELGLFVLLEAFDAADLELAHVLAESHGRHMRLLVGVNCRDLATLQVVPERLQALAPLLPRGVPRVAESGVATPDDAARVAAAGYDVALVGSALMTGREPGALAGALIAAGRKACAASRDARVTGSEAR